jgi:hypothetical protein
VADADGADPHQHLTRPDLVQLQRLEGQAAGRGVGDPGADRYQTSHVTSSESGPLTRAVRIRTAAPGASR